jgi:YVTN family beta-propeller protein
MEFRILGPLEVLDGQQAVRLGAAKQRALLGVLLLHANETVSSARLIDGLWGERPPPTAEKLVQGYVHALRKTLGAGVVVTRAPGYELQVEAGSLDIQEFERLIDEARASKLEQAVELRAQALALWRGAPLADVVLEGPERNTLARLSELRLTTQIERIDAELALGRDAQLVGELESLAAANPYQERVAAQLMLALYRSGRQADALHVYQTVRRALSDELGLQPGQELRGLEAAILRQDETLTPAANVARGATPPTEPPSSPPPASRRRRSRLAPALAILVALGVAATAILVFRGEPAPVTVPPNSVAVIDAKTNKLVTTASVGIRPGPIAAGGGFVWVGNLQDRTLSKLDAQGTLVKTIPLDGRTPTGLAFGEGAVWVAHGRLGELSRVDPQFGQVTKTVEAAGRGPYSTNGSVTTGISLVWAVFGDSTLVRVDPDDVLVTGSTLAGGGPADVVVGSGSIWVSNSDSANVQRFNPVTFEEGPLKAIPTGRRPSGMAFGEGAIWVAIAGDDLVTRIDPGSNAVSSIPVGDGPTAVAVGAGAVWVANTAADTVSRIDPATNEVVETIELGNSPAGLVEADGSVWVTVQTP